MEPDSLGPKYICSRQAHYCFVEGVDIKFEIVGNVALTVITLSSFVF